MAFRPINRPSLPAAVTEAAPPDPVRRSRFRPVQRPAVTAPQPVASAPRAHHKVDRTTDNWDADGDYIVGKGKPPKAHQWKPGQSGNPRGPKPQEKLTPMEAFEKEVLADFNIRINGEHRTVNVGTYVLNLLKTGAAKGTVKSQQLLLEYFLAAVRRKAEAADAPEIDAWEQEIIDAVLRDYGLPEAPVVRKARETADEEDGE